jgi:hypothetical protein
LQKKTAEQRPQERAEQDNKKVFFSPPPELTLAASDVNFARDLTLKRFYLNGFGIIKASA